MKTEQDLQQRLASLPDTMEPPGDLWPELAARLAQTPQQTVVQNPVEKEKTQTGWWLAAAAAVMFTVWAPWQQSGDQPVVAQHQQQSDALSGRELTVGAADSGYRNGVVAGRVSVTSETQWRLSNEFEQQRALQLAQINQVPEIYQDWKQQLQIWKQATNLVLLALQYQPDEPGLLRQLSKLQQQELAYLQKMVLADQT
ncbi:MAG: hypothetical protein ACK4NN_15630 [Rheinheimera sp.]